MCTYLLLLLAEPERRRVARAAEQAAAEQAAAEQAAAEQAAAHERALQPTVLCASLLASRQQLRRLLEHDSSDHQSKDGESAIALCGTTRTRSAGIRARDSLARAISKEKEANTDNTQAADKGLRAFEFATLRMSCVASQRPATHGTRFMSSLQHALRHSRPQSPSPGKHSRK